MRVPDAVQRLLRRFDVQITHYHFTYAARRAQLLKHLGIRDLLDVGANTGQYAHEVRFHGYDGRLWSFEPVAAPYEELVRSTQADPGWQAFNLAVSDYPAELLLHVSRDSTFSSAIPLVTSEGRPDSVQVDTETVRADALDNILPTLDGMTGPLGLKVDVQGHEKAVFDGAAATLEKAHFLEFEMSAVEIYEGQDLLPEMMAWCYSQGFVLALSEPAWMLDTGRGLQMNGIFVRRGTQ
ncbi:FkbM family methyltransferase [Nocardioides sp. Soil805]|uniref:FkbM family methyltransferase n=1 Tax=Nocardioides sp. Soil805 TaxID=1736416 RepID=UPI0007037497|nr:FkbM family methyltransferase [Nocardioides sp. Soil805]KRF34300.1 hypothetical protein ASG94_16430 [Nocardioides sp. Soil805]